MPRMITSRLQGAAVVLAVVLAALCAAAPPTYAESPGQAAKRHYLAGTKHYDLQEYKQALEAFKESYRLKDDPVLLFNIGQCHRMLQEIDEALRAYKTYLSRSPDARNRVDVEHKIASLEEERDRRNAAAAAEQQRARDEAAAREAARLQAVPAPAVAVVVSPPPPKKPVYKRWWLWTTVGVVAVGVGVGLGLGLGLKHDKGDPLFPNVQF